MKYRQIKRTRPSLQTAHNYHKGGFFSVNPKEHYTSDEDREAEIEAIAEDLREITKNFPNTHNIEYALLKAHLIIEHILTQYIRAYATTFVTFKDIKFSFSQKIEIAYLLGFGAHDPIVLPTIEGINKLRNQIAHTFELDRARLDEIFRINHEDYENFIVATDRQRVSHLRSICRYLSAMVAGQMIGEFYSVRRYEVPNKDADAAQ